MFGHAMGAAMPWSEKSIMEQRREFVMLFEQDGVNRRALCRRFGISPETGYALVRRYRHQGEAGLADHSRRPQQSPARTPQAMEALVLSVRREHPCWGGRKIGRRLRDLGHAEVPSASTITEVLRRHQQIDPAASAARERPQRFERAAPNELWQMDFKGHFPLAHGRCHPLTVLDDHSRYALGIRACGDETGDTVQGELTAIFRRYGLPDCMLMDNGSPWGSSNAEHRYTGFELWLMELGIAVTHGRPYHPQTQGKSLPRRRPGTSVSTARLRPRRSGGAASPISPHANAASTLGGTCIIPNARTMRSAWRRRSRATGRAGGRFPRRSSPTITAQAYCCAASTTQAGCGSAASRSSLAAPSPTARSRCVRRCRRAASRCSSAAIASPRSIYAKRCRDALGITLAPVGPQAPPAPRAARLLAVAARGAGPSCGLPGRATPVQYVSEHPSTMSPAFTPGGRREPAPGLTRGSG